MEKNKIIEEMDKITWRQKLDLGNGIITPGIISPNWKLKFIDMPEDLTGKTVLDIGAWDGAFSFEAEKRGAKRVLATDKDVWEGRWPKEERVSSGKDNYSKVGFEFVRKVLNSKVEDKTIDVYDLSPETVGIFDVVLFMGVLYHLRHPLLALDKISSVTKEMLILETATDMLNVNRPAMGFYPTSEFGGPTGWFGPNPDAVEAMLKNVGFKKVVQVGSTKIKYRTTFNEQREEFPSENSIPTNRIAFHAFK